MNALLTVALSALLGTTSPRAQAPDPVDAATAAEFGDAESSPGEDDADARFRTFRDLPTLQHIHAARLALERVATDPKQPDPLAIEVGDAARMYEIAIDYVPGNATPFEPPDPGPRLDRSPLSAYAHLRIAAEEARQELSAWGNSPVRFTPRIQRRYESLRACVDRLEAAVDAAETARGWILHDVPTTRLTLTAPARLVAREALNNWALRVQDEQTQELVFVRVLDPIVEHTLDELLDARRAYVAKQGFEEYRSGDEDRVETGAFRRFYEFTYSYRWKGQEIRALVRGIVHGGQVFEVNCVAPKQVFDRALFEEVLDSVP